MLKYLLSLILLIFIGCKKPYEPPEIQAQNQFLVVDGVINASADGVTTIRLSRSRSLTDTVVFIPEENAQIWIENITGFQYPLQEAGNGYYRSFPLTLTPTQYRLRIRTSNNNQYLSQYLDILQTPAIDSITWRQETDVHLFVNTHDPQNNTRYYRWDFEETWEYRSPYESILEFKNGQVQFRDTSDYVYRCWRSALSDRILVHNTVKLSSDKVVEFPLATVKRNDEKTSVKYSILVKQYALTPKAYEYWSVLKKNSEELGTLFDAQPAQIFSNVYNPADRNERVIGYVTASTVSEHRIFIRESQVQKEPMVPDCGLFIVEPSQAPQYLINRPDLMPAYNVTGGGVAIAKSTCVDCRLKGGTTARPVFWQ